MSAPAGGEFVVRGPQQILIPERLDSETRMMADSAAEFLRREVLPAADRLEAGEPGRMADLLRRAAALGLLATDVPEAHGGLGLKSSTSARIAEALAAEPSFSVSHSVHTTVASLPIVLFGTPEQRRRFLPGLASGETIGAFALTEAHCGSDAMAMRARAVASGDGAAYLISGEKTWITNAAFAGLFIAFALVDGRPSAFVVERGTAGLSNGREERKLGLHGSSTCRLILDRARVPAGNLLGRPGDGAAIALSTLNLGRFKVASSAVGQCKNLLGIAARYAKERRAFGVPIAELGLIQEKLAQMASRTYAAESMLYRVAGCLDETLPDFQPDAADSGTRNASAAEEYAIECALVKVACTEALGFVADECLQIHGGYGYSEEYPPARAWRDARVTRIYEGTNEVNRLALAGMVLNRLESGRIDSGLVSPTARPEPTFLDDFFLHYLETIRLACQGFLAQTREVARGPEDGQLVTARLADLVMALYEFESSAIRAATLDPGVPPPFSVSPATCAAALNCTGNLAASLRAAHFLLAAEPKSVRPLSTVVHELRAPVADQPHQIRALAAAVLARDGYPL